jgi:hypothetical protein
MLSTIYTVNINAISGPANSDGFLDVKTIPQYMAAGSTPTNLNKSLTKERANVRVDNLVKQLQLVGNLYVTNMNTTGADANTDGTAFTCTVEVERGDSILTTPDESNAGQTLSGAAAIKRFIARSLLVTQSDDYAEYYDPTATSALTANGSTVSAVRYGTKIGQVVTGKLANTIAEAEAVITVTKINV